MPARRFRSSLTTVVAVAVVIASAAIIQTRRHTYFEQAPPAAARPGEFAHLIRVNGALYWTVNHGDEHSVYAMTPPGHPILLYRERGERTFGALASPPQLAVVAHGRGSSHIQLLTVRAGGQPRRFAAPRLIGAGDLVTAGSRLVWVDDRGLRTMPATGGPARTLVREGGVTNLTSARGRLFYVSSGRTVKSVALSGDAPRTELRTANTITALCVNDRIYWSELGVSVRSSGRTHWVGTGGRHTTGISCAGSRLAWSDCPAGHTGCQVLIRSGTGVSGFGTGPGLRDLDDNGADTAYLTSDGPGVRTADPTWHPGAAAPAPLRPECLRRPCYRTSLPG